MRVDRLRECSFTLAYEPGTGPVVDYFFDQPQLRLSVVDVTTGRRSAVRFVRLTGPPEAVDRLQTVLEEREYLPRAIGDGRCRGWSSYSPLECAPGRRLVYVAVDELSGEPSVLSLVSTHLRRGTVTEHSQQGGRERWRLLVRAAEPVREVYDRIDAACGDGVTVDVGHVGTPREWDEDWIAAPELAGPQQQAIVQAAANGYYERPREITLEELADELDVPASTLSYRLRVAESTLVERYLDRCAGAGAPSHI
ncbi:helix-turn-helix domain-containing protein [Natronobeatus ordinarius]|uniref:helix-turn-helix domain-containing protein n=1 Tax=Natronobeatus ordinarius TaxID=2963433 RepID=UPI0020CC82EE|nr:helix-turn-helix domain-containing protein [Natronobeatus ordinarius]